jgi:hypothetical protein
MVKALFPKPQLPDGNLNSGPKREFGWIVLEGLVGLELSFGQQEKWSHKEGEVEGVKAWREGHYVINHRGYHVWINYNDTKRESFGATIPYETPKASPSKFDFNISVYILNLTIFRHGPKIIKSGCYFCYVLLSSCMSPCRSVHLSSPWTISAPTLRISIKFCN